MAQKDARTLTDQTAFTLARAQLVRQSADMQLASGDSYHDLWKLRMPLLDKDGCLILMGLIRQHVEDVRQGTLKRLYQKAKAQQVEALTATVSEAQPYKQAKAQDEDGTADYEGD